MKRRIVWAIALAAMTLTQVKAGDPGEPEVRRGHFLGRIRPVGGCNPDGRGLFHWWNPHCYPRWCGPDDYCRKPMPNVCRPGAYSYVGALPQPAAPAQAPQAPAVQPPSP
jgi:hypothetical protein